MLSKILKESLGSTRELRSILNNHKDLFLLRFGLKLEYLNLIHIMPLNVILNRGHYVLGLLRVILNDLNYISI